MSFGPDYHLAGGYFDTGNNPSQTLSAGIFRPPASPADSNHNLGKSTGSLFSDISMSNGTSPLQQTPEQANAKRKRLGLGVRGGTQNDYNMQVDGMNEVKQESGMADAGQTRYNLAGQLNATPTGGAVTANGRLEESMYSDLDYRRAAGSKRAHDDPDGPSSHMEGQVDPSAQHQNPANSSGKWGFFGLQTIGQVMGKVWEFCKGGPFRGFQAGGGTGYEVNGSTVTPSVQATAVGQPWAREQQEQPVHFTMEADQDTSMPPQETVMAPVITPIAPVPPTVQEFTVPAQEFSSPLPYPTSDYMPFAPEYHETNNHDSLTRPAVKRRQVSENQDDLNRNWVMVDENGNGGSPSPSPALPSFGAAAPGRATPGLRPPSSLRARTPGLSSSNASRRITAPSQRFTGGPSMLPRTRAPSRLSQHTVAPTQELPSFGAPRSPPVRDTPTPSFSTPTTTAAPPVSRIPLPASASGGPGSGGARPSFGSINAAASNGRQSPAAFNGRQSPSYANPPAPFAFSSPAYQSSVPRPSSRASVGGGGNGSGSTRRSLQAPIQLNSSTSSGVPRPSSSSAAKVLKSPTNHHHPHQHRRGESSGSVAGSSSTRPGSSSMRRSRGLSLHGAYVEDGLKAMSNSPRLDGEAKHLAKKKMAAERDADANIDAFNEKLLQMIRQGKEALGTKVEVLDDRGGIGAGNSGVWEDDEL
ncbi:hypothetical protein B0T20DRAFT_180834 [Sordaria brevicollis]|uniref:Uncharacterized protein n=1 Tax=Sordaria brevicollis TaxID=83679 RepID=A0AAE0PHZ0_SORBR|nr:hypothetical protein B0T20DRAFT_180834 [Sordaria brevicollis]